MSMYIQDEKFGHLRWSKRKPTNMFTSKLQFHLICSCEFDQNVQVHINRQLQNAKKKTHVTCFIHFPISYINRLLIFFLYRPLVDEGKSSPPTLETFKPGGCRLEISSTCLVARCTLVNGGRPIREISLMDDGNISNSSSVEPISPVV